MAIELKHEHRERTSRIEEQDSYSGEVCGFDFVFTEDGQCASLSISPKDWSRLRLGILQCHPKFVSDLRRFAAVAPDVLNGIADALAEIGKEDLRTVHERRMDELESQFRKCSSATSTD